MPDRTTVLDARELHHGSHAHLLRDEDLPDRAATARLDAIIVPTAWPVDALRHVMRVGKRIDCPVVALCSRAASAEQARKLADHEEAALLAVDVDDSLARLLPSFATDRLLRGEGFGSVSDLSLKRNLGLVLARGSGWRRVLFLDDDIHVDDPPQLHRAAGLVDRYRAVGLANHGYADNSVVCHAYRKIGGPQDTFIGGGAMIVDAVRTTSFYPNIYNEDWLFLLGDGVPFQAARAGVMRQRAYDPFANPARAAAEELGDTLAEGLYWLLDYERNIDTARHAYWGDALFRRRAFIDLIIARLGGSAEHDRVRRSLEKARGRSADITHWLCQNFMVSWKTDLERWREFLADAPAGSGPDEVLLEFGVSDRALASRTYEDRFVC
ncbi:hypothetical protein ACFQFC_07445 [Amorphoplanes digitatis]|uniref:Glycosyltransferase n=1 Tax=Actinoplanes digitatis TaxID=1868 RepID=A0A7W7I091_9ACTN|nr:hypothetical protein [Actinoplanes digitatis]MBB4764037.1 hypothetical protein [Actinoplanes digitatis]GID93857.1 hypothetical protein Adi01nite_32690 [Actinoplanes digitatis]